MVVSASERLHIGYFATAKQERVGSCPVSCLVSPSLLLPYAFCGQLWWNDFGTQPKIHFQANFSKAVFLSSMGVLCFSLSLDGMYVDRRRWWRYIQGVEIVDVLRAPSTNIIQRVRRISWTTPGTQSCYITLSTQQQITSRSFLGVLLITSIVRSFNLLYQSLHLLNLPLNLRLLEPFLPAEQLPIWPAIAASNAVPKRGELSVIVVEIVVVDSVAGGSIDHR